MKRESDDCAYMRRNSPKAEPADCMDNNIILAEPEIMSKDVISRRQLTRMIYVEGFGAAGLTYPAVAVWSGGSKGWLAFVFYGIFLFLFTSFLLWMAKGRFYPAQNIQAAGNDQRSVSGCVPGRLPRWAAGIYLLRFLINITALFYFFGLSVRDIYMPGHRMWWLLFPFAVLLWYCTQTTFQKHARFLELLFPWIAAMFALLIIMAAAGILTKIQGFDGIKELFAKKGSPSGEISSVPVCLRDAARGGYFLLLCSTPLEFIFFLAPFCRSGVDKLSSRQWAEVRFSVIKGVGGGFVCNVLLWFVTVKTLGAALTASTPWPVIKIMQLIHLPGGFLERFDILLVVYWILCIIGVLSAYLYYGRKIVEENLCSRLPPAERKKKMAAGAAAVVFGIYLVVCLFREPESLFRLFIDYKRRIDFPLILLLPLLIRAGRKGGGLQEKAGVTGTKGSRKGGNISCGMFIAVFLILTASLTLTGCQKQSDAEKKRYILSLYIDVSEEGYMYQTADANLAKMNEKESLVPCQIKKTRAKSLKQLEEKFKKTEAGQPEWNHIYTIFIGPGLSQKPDKLIRFLKEWDDSWQKSPNVSVCVCSSSADALYSLGDIPEGSQGQQVSELVSQIEQPGKVCRTPIDILKQYYEGKNRVFLYQVNIRGGNLMVYKMPYVLAAYK